MKLSKSITAAVVTLAHFLISSPVRAQEFPPDIVLQSVYEGIQHIHGYEDTPNLEWVPTGYSGGCGAVDGSLYCPSNHTIYIPENDIDWAYGYGDGALAYIDRVEGVYY